VILQGMMVCFSDNAVEIFRPAAQASCLQRF